MSNKQLLIAIMKVKTDLIKKYTDIDLLVEDDFKEIETWDEEVCSRIIARMQNGETDIRICPWCIEFIDFKEGCPGCNYKERHGCCLDEGETSTYQHITHKAGTSIVNIPGLLPRIHNILKEGV